MGRPIPGGRGEAAVINGVIFDMDGVLADSEPVLRDAAIAMFREHGVRVRPRDFRPFIGTGEDRYLGGVAEQHGVELDIDKAKRRTYEIYLELLPIRLATFSGARNLVHNCRDSGLKIGLASSADIIKIEATLKKIDIPLELWHSVVSAEDVENKKPAPDIFLVAARKLAVPAAECVVVEDSIHGIEAAKAAGMRCVAVAHSFKPNELGQADLVRRKIGQVSMRDLRGR